MFTAIARFTFVLALFGTGASAQAPREAASATAQRSDGVKGVEVPDEYVVGPEDVIAVLFWRDTDMSSNELTVRPDGKITLPLIGEVQAAGLKPDALKLRIQEAASKFVTDPNVTIAVRQINSRKVFITGQVATPGAYALTSPRTVMQLIALAGGLNEYADAENITIMRQDQGRTQVFKFNYKNVSRGTRLEQNIPLKPGDTVVVP